MLSCENLPDNTCPPAMEMDEMMLRQLSPYNPTSSRADDLMLLLHPQTDFIPPQHGKARTLQDFFKSQALDELQLQPHAAITEPCRLPTKVVCGSELNESPASYEVKGLHPHELPVIGEDLHQIVRKFIDFNS